MKKEEKVTENVKEKIIIKDRHCHCQGGSGAIYGLGVVGALFYYLQNAMTFGMVIVGIIKAFFWPAILMFELLSYLKL